MTEKKEEAKEIPWFGIGIIATCCLIPLLPLFFALGSAWISTLTSMQTLRIFFLLPVLFFIGFGYRKLYLLPDREEHGQPCVSKETKQQQRILFWIASIMALLILALA